MAITVLENKETMQPEQLDSEAAQAALQSGSHNLYLKDPEGNPVAVGLSEAQTLLGQGFQHPAPEQYDAILKSFKYNEAAPSLGYGALDVLGGVATRPVASAVGSALGVDLKEYEESREFRPEALPLEAAGLIGSAFIPGGQAKVLGQIGARAGAAAARIAPMAARVAPTIAAGATENMLFQAGDEVAKMMASDDPAVQAESAIPNILTAGLIGGGANLAVAGAGQLLKSGAKAARESAIGEAVNKAATNFKNEIFGTGAEEVPQVLKKGMALVAGVPEQVTETYVKNRDKVLAAPAIEDIREHVLSYVDDVKAAVVDKQMGLNEAKAELKLMAKEVADSTQQGAFNAVPEIVEGVEAIRKKVVEGSQQAYAALERDNRNISLASMLDNFKSSADELGKVPLSRQKEMAARFAKEAKEIAETYPSLEVPAPVAKQIIQKLDEQASWKRMPATEFENPMSGYYKDARRALDKELKQIPEYAELMKPLAKDAEFLDRLKGFGDIDSATRKVSSIKTAANFKTQLPILEELEAKTGLRFVDTIKKYADPVEREALLSAVKATFKDAEKQLLKAKEVAAPFKGLTAESAEKKILKAGKGDIAAIEMLRKVPGMTEGEVQELAKYAATLQAFTKSDIAGSRRTLLGALLGEVFGGAGAVGATTGFVLDRYGPRIGQKLLDVYIDNSGLLAKLNAPRTVVRNAMAKVLSTGAEVTGAGFDAAVKMMTANMLLDKKIETKTKEIFDKKRIEPEKITPEEIKTVEKTVQDIRVRPESIIDMDQSFTELMPDQTANVSASLASVSSYLAKIVPTNEKGMLGNDLPPNQFEVARFNKAVRIAVNPTDLFASVQNGSVTQQDVEALQSMYPALYQKMVNKVTDQLIDAVAEKKSIPYQTKIGISIFTALPIDATLTPEAIRANQKVAPMAAQNANGIGGAAQGISSNKLKTIASSQATAGQARAQNRMN